MIALKNQSDFLFALKGRYREKPYHINKRTKGRYGSVAAGHLFSVFGRSQPLKHNQRTCSDDGPPLHAVSREQLALTLRTRRLLNAEEAGHLGRRRPIDFLKRLV